MIDGNRDFWVIIILSIPKFCTKIPSKNGLYGGLSEKLKLLQIFDQKIHQKITFPIKHRKNPNLLGIPLQKRDF